MVLFSAHRLIMLYIRTKFCENISKGFKVIAKTPFPLFAKGHNSIKYVGGVMVLILCMSFDDALYLYQGS